MQKVSVEQVVTPASWHFTGSKDHRKTDSDGKADWKRSLWRSLDGKVAW